MALKYNSTLPDLPEGVIIPKHIAFSPNGNRRWAEQNKVHVSEGHKAGAQALLKIIEAGYHYGIHTMTFWGFSTENWNRKAEEVGHLMKLFEFLIDSYLDEIRQYDVRIMHLGRKDRLPRSLAKKITDVEQKTKHITNRTLNLSVDYGGHDEILRAVSKVINDVAAGIITKEDIHKTEGWYIENKLPYYQFKNYLDTGNQPHPYPDIVIRMAGDKRTSGFLPWQSAYAEYLWYDEFFPEFSGEHVHDAILRFNNRERRFGGDPST